MKIMVSACLLGENCKYNGGNNYSAEVAKYVEGHEVIPVCPEVEGGLPVPRLCCEMVQGEVTDSNGESRHEAFCRGAEICVKRALAEKVDLAILQPRSPSCGVKQIYDGTFSGTLIPGSGVFAKKLMEQGIHVCEPDDLAMRG